MWHGANQANLDKNAWSYRFVYIYTDYTSLTNFRRDTANVVRVSNKFLEATEEVQGIVMFRHNRHPDGDIPRFATSLAAPCIIGQDAHHQGNVVFVVVLPKPIDLAGLDRNR